MVFWRVTVWGENRHSVHSTCGKRRPSWFTRGARPFLWFLFKMTRSVQTCKEHAGPWNIVPFHVMISFYPQYYKLLLICLSYTPTTCQFALVPTCSWSKWKGLNHSVVLWLTKPHGQHIINKNQKKQTAHRFSLIRWWQSFGIRMASCRCMGRVWPTRHHHARANCLTRAWQSHTHNQKAKAKDSPFTQ